MTECAWCSLRKVKYNIKNVFAKLIIYKWGNLKIQKVNKEWQLTMNLKYGIYFFIYFLIALLVGIWQFWLFSQNF